MLLIIPTVSVAAIATGSEYKLDRYSVGSCGGALEEESYNLDFVAGHSAVIGSVAGTSYKSELGYLGALTTSSSVESGVSLDGDYSTQGYDQDAITATAIEGDVSVDVGDEVWLAIVAQNVVNLDTYEVVVSYDATQLTFVEGMEDSSFIDVENLLKLNGGTTTGFTAVESSSGVVNVANALNYEDTSEAPEGTGIIGLLRFSVLTEDSIDVTITSANFLNSYGYNQSISSLSNLTISSGSSDSDSDNDGVLDSADQCSDTPSGESVDADGCSTSQLDSDDDGVTDDGDLCSDTPSGESVDNDGCSSSQLDSDGDGLSDALESELGTDPELKDTDIDGCTDYEEYECGSDPLLESSMCSRGMPWLMLLLEDE
jgi:hypothetical protein